MLSWDYSSVVSRLHLCCLKATLLLFLDYTSVVLRQHRLHRDLLVDSDVAGHVGRVHLGVRGAVDVRRHDGRIESHERAGDSAEERDRVKDSGDEDDRQREREHVGERRQVPGR